MNGPIRLDDMRIFLAVATAHSFTKAAATLAIPKQTVSRRVSELEHALGVQLLHRTTRSLRLTEAGELYGTRCAEVIQLAESANDDVRTRTSTKAAGRLRLSADPTFGQFFLFDIVDQYLADNPGVVVDLLLSTRHVNLVEEGFDAAIRIGVLEDSSIISRRLGPAEIRYCASPRYLEQHGVPMTPQELKDHQCIVQRLHSDPPQWPFKGENGPTLLRVSGRLYVNDFQFAMQAALAGHGVAIFPAFSVEAALASGALVSVLDNHLWENFGGIYLVYPNEKHTTSKLRTFIDLATEVYAAGEA